MSEATLLEIQVMKDPENAIVPAEAMHDVDERNIEARKAHMQRRQNEAKENNRANRCEENQKGGCIHGKKKKKKVSTALRNARLSSH